MPTSGKVILDPTGVYSIPDDVDVVSTERQWLESIGRSNRTCWVKGEWLSRWTREWLRQRGESDLIVEEKTFPRARLQYFLKNIPVPQSWDDRRVLQWVIKLDSYDSDSAIPYLLTDLVPAPPNFWFGPPSLEHLAQFLSMEVQDGFRPFLDVWCDELSERCDEPWTRFYKAVNRDAVVRAWIGLDESDQGPGTVFPLAIPPSLADEFDSVWTRRIVETSGGAIDLLRPQKVSGMNRVAQCASRVLNSRCSWITESRIRKLLPYLSPEAGQRLFELMPPRIPRTVESNATADEVLRWATEEYLPFRKWQALNDSKGPVRDTAEALADSFVNWIAAAYPKLKVDPVTESSLNYSVASLVVKATLKGPVLWAVIDGLGWLEHVELVKILCSAHAFQLKDTIQPKLSILPTKTEFAKWSLYAQLLPNHPSWEPDAGKGFRGIPEAERYTDSPGRRESLVADIQGEKHRIYCWDTTEYDCLYHDDTSWNHLVDVSVPLKLNSIAKEIAYLVSKYPVPSAVQIILCSDHGQLMGEQIRLDELPMGFEFGGRMAIGRVSDPRFFVLEADRFGVKQDISVVRGSGCIRSFQANHAGEIVGVHGGLFPEEVVIGVSTLQWEVRRHPISVICHGKGRAKESGSIQIEITNPNNTSLADAMLYLNEVEELAVGRSLEVTVEPYGHEMLSIPVKTWPELLTGNSNNQIRLTGSLEFRFGGVENGSVVIADSSIEVTQMFRSGLDIDDFI
jgi:hypothetical protein